MLEALAIVDALGAVRPAAKVVVVARAGGPVALLLALVTTTLSGCILAPFGWGYDHDHHHDRHSDYHHYDYRG